MAANVPAYGFWNLADQLGRRVSDLGPGGVQIITDAIKASAQEFTRSANEAIDKLAIRTNKYKFTYRMPGAGTAQAMTDEGIIKPNKPGTSIDVSLPWQHYATAFSLTRAAASTKTIGEIQDDYLDCERRMSNALLVKLLGAIFNDDGWTFTDPEKGSLTIKPLANSDTDVYLKHGGTTATATMYRATASAIADNANPFTGMRTALMAYPHNSGEVVCYVPTNLRDDVEALTDLIEPKHPNLILGSGSNSITGVPETIKGPGVEVFGFLKGPNFWMVEWPRLPDNYMFAHCPSSPNKPLAMRELTDPALQGLISNRFDTEQGSKFTFEFMNGFGALNRVGAVVQRIGDASYDPPTDYTTLPV